MCDYLSAGNKLFNPNWCNELFLISLTTMSKDTSRGHGKDVSLFSMHQAEKTSKDIAETTKIGISTVQRIIKN